MQIAIAAIPRSSWQRSRYWTRASSSAPRPCCCRCSRRIATAHSSSRTPRCADEAEFAVKMIDRRVAFSVYAGRLFAGVSLASILMLAALGLAITYGLLGVINMAHGEMIMIGAYATYVVQKLFKTHAPGCVRAGIRWPRCRSRSSHAALVGMRARAHGDPLAVRTSAGNAARHLGHQPVPDSTRAPDLRAAERRSVAIRAGCRAAVEFANLTLPYSRIVIIVFAIVRDAAHVADALAHAAGTVHPRRDAEPRMASCVGVNTGASTWWRSRSAPASPGWPDSRCRRSATSARSSGSPTSSIRSWWWCWAASVSSQARVYAALGLGVISKFMEPYIGAVSTKILILVLIIAFIQKRPQGLFALRGRAVEA